jgi:hypothetical protein
MAPVPLLARAGCLRPHSNKVADTRRQRQRSPAQAQTPQDQPANANPTPRPVGRPRREPAVPLVVRNPDAAGIDVPSDRHMVCVPANPSAAPTDNPGESLPANVRKFGANSCDLLAIADWLTECGVTTVALESTGVY